MFTVNNRDGKLYSVSRALQCDTLGPCNEPFQHVPETVGLATSSRSVATFARPSAGSALTCEERHDSSVCGGGVPVCGQSGISVAEGGTGDTSFFTVRMDMRPKRTNK